MDITDNDNKISSKKTFRLRKLSQLVIALFFMALPFANIYGFDSVYGNFLFFSFFKVPLSDPLSTLQVAILSLDITFNMLIGAGVVLIFAMCLGSVFCSWICPYGAMSELIYSRHKNLAINKKARIYLSYGLYSKIFLAFIMLLLAFSYFKSPILNQLSMPGFFSKLWQAIANNDFKIIYTALSFLGIALVLEYILKARIWCRYLCPQSIFISLMRLCLPNSLRVNFYKQKCTCKGHRPCMEACSLKLDPRSSKLGQFIACTNCKDCIIACQKHGKALSFSNGNKSR